MDLNPIEHLWRDLKIAVQCHSPSNLTELEMIYKGEWEELPKYRCAQLVVSDPRRLEAVITAKVLSKGSDYLLKYYLCLKCFYTFAKCSKNHFKVCHYEVLCVD